MKKIKEYWLPALLTILLIALIGIAITMVVGALTAITTEEVIATETLEAVVTNTDYSTYYIKNQGKKTEYIISVRGDDFSNVFSVSGAVYAKYAVGDVVKVDRIEKWNKVEGTHFDYELR